MKTRHLIIAGALLLISLAAGAQTVNLSHSGILTSGYTWAYGSWHVTESVPDNDADMYDFYISVDKYQIRIKDRSLPDIPLAAIPETNYTYNEMDEDMFGVGPDEKLLEFVGRYGEDTYLFINRKDKTLSHFNESDRKERGITVTMEKVDAGTVSAGYTEALVSSPLVGTWQDMDDPSVERVFTSENVTHQFIPAAGGGWEHYLWGLIFTYDPESGLLTARSPFDTEGRRIKTYKRVK
ncbi:MAG: hypothetical protein J5577_00085 [Bacteroidales bacterium]|nr:hypothetical protein [Bacteroidales bacterium]MBR4818095.1 hypothetical protein [Bacteroidales bacterium]